MNSSLEHWGIIGGGMLGLSLAHRLHRAGKQVTILESAPHLGGLASAWQLGDITWDKHYHVILLSDSRVRALLVDLDLESEVEWVETKTGFYTDGKLYSMSNSWEFLKFPPLGLIDKFRLALTILRASRIRDSRPLEDISVVDWLTKWSGRRTFEKIWLPLLRAKLGENYKIASAAFIWAIIARMYAARRSGLKKEMFGYVRGGYARILDRFQTVLLDSNVSIRVNQRIARISTTDDGVLVQGVGGGVDHYDRVIVTAAAPVASHLCPDLSSNEHRSLQGIKYQGIVCASMLLKKPLAQYYVTNITDDWVPFTAVIEMTALVDRKEFNGQSLIYLPKYVDPRDSLFEESDEQIRTRFLTAIQRMYPHFHLGDVVAFRVSRVKNVFAVTTKQYSQHVPSITTSLPGIYLVNSANIVNGTLNVNETLQLAETALPKLLTHQVPAFAAVGGVA